MILVDTSVWIDFFAGRDLSHVATLEQLILDNEDLALCGIILTEILQGISHDTTYRHVRRDLSPLIMLPMPSTVFVRAADIYRKLRKQGITIRKSNDCIIAATALEHHCQLLHNDKDFLPIAKQFPLKAVKI
ncbi:MAG: PIN domain nuclease [Gammaproteobacteria bacterium]|nr:PIN domain nuclease [Gammaproteobacteria bacterium]